MRLLTNTEDNTTFSVVDADKCPKPPKPLLLAATGNQITAMGRNPAWRWRGPRRELPGRTRERWLLAGHPDPT
ncbi:hypothetical protein ACU4GD_01935 [Cupriavidus basilensis]